jgi:hypothetical protein
MNKEQLKKEIPNLSDKEKEICLKYLISENHPNLNLNEIKSNIKDNNLSIISNNEKVK